MINTFRRYVLYSDKLNRDDKIRQLPKA